MTYIAHIRESDGVIQSVREHLFEVKLIAEHLGSKIGVKHLAGLSGLLHDLGKNSEAFLTYIQQAVAHPDRPPPKGSVDHSTAGAKLLYELYHRNEKDPLTQLIAECVGMCIISHHGGLRDFISPNQSSPYLERVKFKDIPEFESSVTTFYKQQMNREELDQYFRQAVNEMKNLLATKKIRPIMYAFILKYVFSCLIDADRTNSRMFEENETGKSMIFNYTSFFSQCYQALMKRIDAFSEGNDAHHPINQLRSEMSLQCELFAEKPSGIYTLSIPTGGGKTLASLRYALKHAEKYGKERIIYIVPYTTIIEQNAKEVIDILKDYVDTDTNVLEHHSNVIEDLEEEDEKYDIRKKALKLAKDNWDSPIIFTTMVQFLNVFYSKGTRNVRRLHNLTNAVLIFDEVQSVPVKCVSLFNEALNFLSEIGRSSIVLCTATQPALHFVKNKLNIAENAEIIENLPSVKKSFKRVNLIDLTDQPEFNAIRLTDFVLDEMRKIDSIMIILNTKTAVRKLAEELNDRDDKDFTLFHLSTGMCPAHRKKVISEMKELLKVRQRVVCVSTQLIEAGVDISFQCVIRSLAGLDSIAQAAGRCNRHGKDEIRNVYIIRSADENLRNLQEIKVGAEKTLRLLSEFRRQPKRFDHDLLSSEAMQYYFHYFYTEMKENLDYWIREIKQHAHSLLDANIDNVHAIRRKDKNVVLRSTQSFATVEQHFQVINEPTTSVLVPYNDEARKIITDLNGDLDSRYLTMLLKRAQQYCINLYHHEFEKLDQNRNIDVLLHGNVYALNEVAYSNDIGLSLDGEEDMTVQIM